MAKPGNPNSTSDPVIAKEFRVVDDSGTKRAVLHLYQGLPRLALFDSKGRPYEQIVLADNNQPALMLGNMEKMNTGKTILMVENDSYPALLMTNKNGQTVALIKVELNNLPKIELFGIFNESSQAPQITIHFKDSGQKPYFRFTNNEYKVTWETP